MKTRKHTKRKKVKQNGKNKHIPKRLSRAVNKAEKLSNKNAKMMRKKNNDKNKKNNCFPFFMSFFVVCSFVCFFVRLILHVCFLDLCFAFACFVFLCGFPGILRVSLGPVNTSSQRNMLLVEHLFAIAHGPGDPPGECRLAANIFHKRRWAYGIIWPPHCEPVPEKGGQLMEHLLMLHCKPLWT